jgi:hypothetical protein
MAPSAWLKSDGMMKTLLASPCASLGGICGS